MRETGRDNVNGGQSWGLFEKFGAAQRKGISSEPSTVGGTEMLYPKSAPVLINSTVAAARARVRADFVGAAC